MSDEELKALKQQIKEEVLQEMNDKKITGWKRITREYEQEFTKYNFIEKYQGSDLQGKTIEYQITRNMGDLLRTATCNIVKVTYKANSIANLDIDYDELKNTVDKILKIVEEGRKYLNGNDRK